MSDEKTLKRGKFDLLVAVPEEWDARDKVTKMGYYKISSDKLFEHSTCIQSDSIESSDPWKTLITMDVQMAHEAYTDRDKGIQICGTFYVNLSSFHPRRS